MHSVVQQIEDPEDPCHQLLHPGVSIEIRTHRSFALFEHRCVGCIVSILRWPLPLWHSYVLRGLPWCPRICRSRHHNLAWTSPCNLHNRWPMLAPINVAFECPWMQRVLLDKAVATYFARSIVFGHVRCPYYWYHWYHPVTVSHLRPAPSCSNLWADNFLIFFQVHWV